MRRNFEKLFREELHQRRQKKRKRIVWIIATLLLIGIIVKGFAYLLHQSNPNFRISNLDWSSIILLLSIVALICIFGFIFYLIKNQPSRKNYDSLLLKLQIPIFRRIRSINYKYLAGYTLLLIAIICQANPPLFTNPINNFIVNIVYKPKAPVLNSPWPWKNNATIHPIIANMPSEVETSIKSVAKYVAEKELNPYLRVKALHDYVVSRTSYDLEVLKTGTRPAQDAEAVFFSHKAVCEGYANLFKALGRAMGIDVAYVEGTIRRDLVPKELISQYLRVLNSDYDWTLHAWNAVKIYDNWQLVDTTWDDGDSSYSADYFLPPAKVMIMSHFPHQEAWQLLDHPKSKNNFEANPILTPQFFIEDLTLISPDKYQTTVRKTAFIKIQSPQSYNKDILAAFTKIKEDKPSFWKFPEANKSSQDKLQKCESQRNFSGETQIFCQFPKSGDYQVIVVSRGQKVDFIGQLKFHAL
jgi:Transglutaminase-like superfamily